MTTEVTGIIISETAYGETSKIVNILTKEKGLIGVMCKGAKSIKSKNRALTGLLSYGVFCVIYKENKLSTLISANLINPLVNIKSSLEKISYTTYICELTSQVYKESLSKEIYDLFIESILKIEEGLDEKIIANILELKYLYFLGVGLNLNECVKCLGQKNIVTIDFNNGGLICKKCYKQGIIVSSKAIKLLRLYYYIDIKNITSLNVDSKVYEEINTLLSSYYDDFTGIYVYSKKFLEKLL